MMWVTRHQIRVNRPATAWLVRRFVDKEAEFLFVNPDDVRFVEQEQNAIGFDAPGARFENVGGKTSFELIIEQYQLRDPALVELARIVHAADIPGALSEVPEAAGLRAISHGFPLVSRTDHETLRGAFFLYDALYAHLKERTKGA